jgi:hypothetical protein
MRLQVVLRRSGSQLNLPSGSWKLHRQDFTVYYKRLQREISQMLVALQSGQSLNEVFSAGSVENPMSKQVRPHFIQQCFSQCTTLGWLCQPA